MRMTRKEAAEQLDHLLCATVMRIENDRKELRGKKTVTFAQRAKMQILPIRMRNVRALIIAIRELRKEI